MKLYVFSVDLSLALSALALRPAGLHAGLGVTTAVCSAHERDAGERAKLALPYRETATRPRSKSCGWCWPTRRRRYRDPRSLFRRSTTTRVLIKEKRKENRYG
jgi:hypothetical protein